MIMLVCLLAPGDTAFLQGFGGSTYPASVTYYDPPYYGFRARLTGTFSLVNGQIVSWNLLGSNAQFGCGIGPGCEAGSSSVGSDPSSDTETYDPDGYTRGPRITTLRILVAANGLASL